MTILKEHYSFENVCIKYLKMMNTNKYMTFRYLLAINALVFSYSFVQLMLLLKHACIGKNLLARPTSSSSTYTLICDKVFISVIL